MGRERGIVIGTIAFGCTLGFVLWLMGTTGADATALRTESEDELPLRGADAVQELADHRRIPIATTPFDPEPEPEPAAGPARTCVTGRIWDVNGALGLGARVGLGRATFEEGEEKVAEWRELWADTEGRYRFRATPGWRVHLWADSSSSIATLLPPFEIAPGENRVEDIHLDPGLTVSGRVRDEVGAPMSEVIIEFSATWPIEEVFPEFSPHRLLPKSLQPLGKRYIWTRKDGTYLLKRLHPHSRLRVSAHHETLVARQGTLEVDAGAATVDFDLERLRDGLIKGRIVRVPREDLAGILVQIREDRGSKDWAAGTSVDPTGCFEIRIRNGFAGALRAVDRLGRHEPSPPRRVVVTPGRVVEDVVLALGNPQNEPLPPVGIRVR